MPQFLPLTLRKVSLCVAAQLVWYVDLLASEASSLASSRPVEASAAFLGADESKRWASLTLSTIAMSIRHLTRRN